MRSIPTIHFTRLGTSSSLRRLLSRGPLRHEATITEELPFSEIYDRFFAGRAIPEAHGKCISSRHFDAIGTGTCQILLEGRYNDILKPGEHYIALSHDFEMFVPRTQP